MLTKLIELVREIRQSPSLSTGCCLGMPICVLIISIASCSAIQSFAPKDPPPPQVSPAMQALQDELIFLRSWNRDAPRDKILDKMEELRLKELRQENTIFIYSDVAEVDSSK